MLKTTITFFLMVMALSLAPIMSVEAKVTDTKAGDVKATKNDDVSKKRTDEAKTTTSDDTPGTGEWVPTKVESACSHTSDWWESCEVTCEEDTNAFESADDDCNMVADCMCEKGCDPDTGAEIVKTIKSCGACSCQ